MKHNYSDIICTVPSFDDDSGWTQDNVWFHASGKRTRFTLCDNNGSHEPILKRDVDSILKNESKEWDGYYQWVIDNNGDDPLEAFLVKRFHIMKRNCVAIFDTWIGAEKQGMRLQSVSFGSRKVSEWKQIPKPIRDFIGLENINGNTVAPWAKSIDDAREYCADTVGYFGRYGYGFFIKFTAEWRKPRDKRLIDKDCLKLAKKHFAEAATKR
jgi:hypothetical protein